MKEKFVTTEKGLALISAIKNELLPEVDGGWDDTVFKEFWERYQNSLHNRKRGDKRDGKDLAREAAIESGMMPKTLDGWDEEKFDEFWYKYQCYVLEQSRPKRERLSIISLIVSAVLCAISVATLIVKLVC